MLNLITLIYNQKQELKSIIKPEYIKVVDFWLFVEGSVMPNGNKGRSTDGTFEALGEVCDWYENTDVIFEQGEWGSSVKKIYAGLEYLRERYPTEDVSPIIIPASGFGRKLLFKLLINNS